MNMPLRNPQKRLFFSPIIILIFALLVLARIVEAMTPISKYGMIFARYGDAYYRKGNAAKAEKYYRKSLYFDPLIPEAYFGLGKIYYDRGEYSKSIDSVWKALFLDFGLDGAVPFLAKTLIEQGDFHNAEILLRKAVRFGNITAQCHYYLGEMYLAQNLVDKAQMQVEEVASHKGGELLSKKLEAKVHQARHNFFLQGK